MSNGNSIIICLIVGLIKNISLQNMSYFAEPYSCNGNKITVGLDWSNYATKSDLKNTKGVDTSDFAKKADLATLKSDVD